MKSLFKNSFFRIICQYWFLPVLWTTLAWGIGGRTGLEIAIFANTILAAMIVSVFLAAAIKAANARNRIGVERFDRQYRFLCPHCLYFGKFLHECGSCKSLVEQFQVATKGEFNPTCVKCEAIIFPGAIKASCEKCKVASDAELHHHRKVEVLVTLTADNFQKLLAVANPELQSSHRQIEFFFHGDKKKLLYVLDFVSAAQIESHYDGDDVWRWIDAIWLDVNPNDLLLVARQLDALIRNFDLNIYEAQRRRIKFFVRQEQLDSVLRLRLEQQFGKIYYGISPEQVFSMTSIPTLSAAKGNLLINQTVEPKVADVQPEARS